MNNLTVLELCAGAGGMALGLDWAGFRHAALTDNDADCCATLRRNCPDWNVAQANIRNADVRPYYGADLVAGGVPCQPFSVAGRQEGQGDSRDLFEVALSVIQEVEPKAVMLENVRGFLSPKFGDYRKQILDWLHDLGFEMRTGLLNAKDFGLPQNRPRAFIVGLRPEYSRAFEMPKPQLLKVSVGDLLHPEMASGGWEGAGEWRRNAAGIAPAIAAGSDKHTGGADFSGGSSARKAWKKLGVNAASVAEHAPAPGFTGMPRLTLPMCARVQGFPADWEFTGDKRSKCRQIGNALPPPLAFAVAQSITRALRWHTQTRAA